METQIPKIPNSDCGRVWETERCETEYRDTERCETEHPEAELNSARLN